MYLTIKQAVRELENRNADPTIRDKVVDFLGGSLPPGFHCGNLACIARHMATSSNEDIAFAQLACQNNLKPWWPEYTGDIFTSNNPGKVALVKFSVRLRNKNKWISLVRDFQLLDQAKPKLRSVVITSPFDKRQMLLTSFHHYLRRQVMPDIADNHRDISAWLEFQALRFGCPKDARSKSRYYYPATMSPYIAFGILFEDFHNGPNQSNLEAFRKTTLDPALKILETEIGLPPLIVKFEWQEEYAYYPQEILDCLRPAAW